MCERLLRGEGGADCRMPQHLSCRGWCGEENSLALAGREIGESPEQSTEKYAVRVRVADW